MNRPPIALMVYNRPSHTKLTLDALINNIGADKSYLFVFSDGPKNQSDIQAVNEVRALVKNYSDNFKQFEIVERESNIGLAQSVISGVTDIVNQFGTVIVLEDDIVSSRNMLNYFQATLDFYENTELVYSISAYSNPKHRFEVPNYYNYDAYFIPRMMCWGWATWADRWKNANWRVDDFAEFLRSEDQLKDYRKAIGSDSLQTLKANVAGVKDVWACRWVYTHFKNNSVCLCPVKSLVNNIGLDGSGSNCGVDKNNFMDLDVSNINYDNLPKEVFLDMELHTRFMSVYNKNHLKATENIIKKEVVGGLPRKRKSVKKRIKNYLKKVNKVYKETLKNTSRLFSLERISESTFKKLSISIPCETIYLGTQYGGWRVIPSLIRSDEEVLSAGVGEDISFDAALAKIFKVNIMLLDPTPRAVKHYEDTLSLVKKGVRAPINNGDQYYDLLPEDLNRTTYYKYGLWGKDKNLRFYTPKVKTHVSHSIGNLHNTEDYFEADCLTLKTFLRKVKKDKISILKLDIEGAEFVVLRNLFFSFKIRPKQVLVEFHPGKSEFEKRFKLKTLAHSIMLWFLGYRIASIKGWEYQFVSKLALRSIESAS